MIRISRPVAEVAPRPWRACSVALAITASLIGCAQQPQLAKRSNGKEYFPEGKYGHASPRVVADGQPVPHGGGQYLVGHAYTIAGHTYHPSENESYTAVGLASWYGDAFQGRRTANGEIYDKESISAAHPTIPLPSYARVTNLGNGHSIVVRVNDRGPYHGGRVMDVSSRVADALDFKGAGTARVKVEYIGKAGLEGSDDSRLLATLRLDGGPATLDGSAPYKPSRLASNPIDSLAKAIMPAAPPPAAPAPARPQPKPEPAPVAPVEAIAEPSTPLPALAPAPPARPFDLGKIPNASFPATSVKTSQAPMPPPRLRTAATQKALYFTDGSKVRVQGKDPFARLTTRGSTPLNETR
jgi:rare lipoprotein A